MKTTPDDLLSQWEADYRLQINYGESQQQKEFANRVIKLIQAYRVQREALTEMLKIKNQSWNPDYDLHGYIKAELIEAERILKE